MYKYEHFSYWFLYNRPKSELVCLVWRLKIWVPSHACQLAVALTTMALNDSTNNDGAMVYAPSEITAQTPFIQNDPRNNNCHGSSYLPTIPLQLFSSYPPSPVVPPSHSSSMPVLPPPHFSHHHPPLVVPPVNSLSVSKPINTSTSTSSSHGPDLSSVQIIPPPLHLHHPMQVLPPAHRSYHCPPPIIPPPPCMSQKMTQVKP